MKKMFTLIMLAGFALLAPSAFAGAPMKMASEAIEPAPDPKKKKAGDQCTSSDECQKHHTCVKNGDKGICTAPPRPKLPPGVVT